MTKDNKIKIIKKYKHRKIFDKYKLLFSDIETIIKNNQHVVVIICLLNSENEEIVFESIDDFMIYICKNNSDSIIYFHNFGKFDSTFILKWVVKNKDNIGRVDIIERNNVIYEVSLKKYNIRIRDSLLLIPTSLASIGETFCTVNKKDDFKYDDITEIYYKDKKKVIDLCINDCKVLKEGFTNFSSLIENEFDIKLHSQLSLPSLSFNIFKNKFYNQDDHPISKNPYNEDLFIRESYVGGISEVFKPYLKNGYCYDANSLYPFAMMKNKFPVGKGKFVSGNSIDINNFIGFIECEVIADKEYNFLPYRDDKRGLITPTGKWRSVYFHAEIIKAIELGYQIKFLKGFKYEKEEYIFKNFVNNLYEIRKNSKTKAMNNISKLILNSLYGRFGMKIFTESTKFISSKDIYKLKKLYEITNIHYLGNDVYTVNVIKKSKNDLELYRNSIDTETAVQIASAVTSYARIYMYDFKNIKENECYYTDTDSIFLEKKLDKKFLGVDLGEFKLEYEFIEAYFIAPKVYYIKISDSVDKIVVKGLKKSEFNKENLIEVFKKVVNNELFDFSVNRTNIFKRNLLKLITYIQKSQIIFNFPFNKRVKIIKENKWVDTKALNIKKL
jgi:hypothetical protein